jgi:phenylacetate-CoA ligase
MTPAAVSQGGADSGRGPAAHEEDLPRAAVERLQAERLAALLAEVLPHNRFYARKFAEAGLAPSSVRSPDDLHRLPFTTKAELLADQAGHPPLGEIHALPAGRYTRYHQTSGTTAGRPLRWLDTPASWASLLDTWDALFRMAGLRPGDRLFFAFSFGPFLGFWTAFEAAARAGHLCLPGGGMSSTARLRFLLDNAATVVLCTPTYALRLAEVAQQEGIALAGSPVRALLVAGEPGGSIPATRRRVEEAWGARVFDHHGMTEAGPLGIECAANPGGLHLLETSACVAEVVDPAGGSPVPAGTPGELVVTTLTRPGSPLLRYRTGDEVCVDPAPCPCGRALARLAGGVRGRVDDMVVVRGNNLYPGLLQELLHRFPEVAEYRVEVDRSGALPVLRVEVEPHPPALPETSAGLAARVARALRDELLFAAEVRAVPPGSLPRFEMKARRFHDPAARPTGPGP